MGSPSAYLKATGIARSFLERLVNRTAIFEQFVKSRSPVSLVDDVHRRLAGFALWCGLSPPRHGAIAIRESSRVKQRDRLGDRRAATVGRHPWLLSLANSIKRDA